VEDYRRPVGMGGRKNRSKIDVIVNKGDGRDISPRSGNSLRKEGRKILGDRRKIYREGLVLYSGRQNAGQRDPAKKTSFGKKSGGQNTG